MQYIERNKVMLVAMWLLIVVYLWQTVNYLSSAEIAATYDPAQFTPEQQKLYEKIIAEKKERLPEMISTTEGRVLYLYPDGGYTFEPPKWYQNGEIVLSDAERSFVAGLSPTQTPSWIFWADETSTNQFNQFVVGLAGMLVLGFVFGIVLGYALELVEGLVLVFAVGTAFGLLVGLLETLQGGPSGGFLFVLVFWLGLVLWLGLMMLSVFVTQKYWSGEDKQPALAT